MGGEEEQKQVKMCNWCETKPGTKKCGKCKEVFYCSQACQQQDWTNGHRKACGQQLYRDPISRLQAPDTCVPVKKEKKEFKKGVLEVEEKEEEDLDKRLEDITDSLLDPLPAAEVVAAQEEEELTFEENLETAIMSREKYEKVTGLNGGWLAGIAEDRSGWHPFDRVLETIQRLNEALFESGNHRRMLILHRLDELLTDIVHPDCDDLNTVIKNGEHSEVVETREHIVDRGCELIRQLIHGRQADKMAMQEELNVCNKLVECAKLIAKPAVTGGNKVLCKPYQTRAEVYVKQANRDLAAEDYTRCDEANAPDRHIDAIRKRAECHMDQLVHGDCKHTEGEPLNNIQNDHIDQALADAKLVLNLAGQNMTAWDRIQVARYLFWTVQWRQLDAETCIEAEQAFTICQNLMAGGNIGQASYDMGQRIASSLVSMGFQSDMDGLE